MTEPDISVVIPVCHGGRFLRALLTSTMNLDFPADRFEVLVAAEGGDADACSSVEEAAGRAPFGLRLVRCETPNRAQRLNKACSVASGRILAFTDDDCVLPRDWLRRIEAVMEEEEEVGAVGGGEVPLAESPFDSALDWVLNSFVATGGCRSQEGPQVGRFYPKLWNMAVPKEVAAGAALPGRDGEAKVFDESLTVHEDVELVKRIIELGKRIVCARELRVAHSRDTTYGSFLKRNFAMARICRREGIHRLAHRVLAGALLGGGVLAAAAIWLPWLRPVLLAGGGLYAALLAASAAAAAAARRSLAAGAWVPAMLLGVHLARAFGYLSPAGRSGSGACVP